jgi:hypothetical protein
MRMPDFRSMQRNPGDIEMNDAIKDRNATPDRSAHQFCYKAVLGWR